MLSEHSLIETYAAPLTKGFAGALNLTNDGAALYSTAEQTVVVTTDTLNEGVHFFGFEAPKLLAQKTLRASLSDIAAMGATPLAYTVNVSLPKKNKNPEAFFADFYAGLAADQEAYKISLCGGDCTRSEHSLSITITAFGLCPRIITRAGAKIGDKVFVTGTLGDAFAGLQLLRQSQRIEEQHPLHRAYLLPEPRVAMVDLLQAYEVGALIDISDGLLAEAAHLAKQSAKKITLYPELLPLSRTFRAQGYLWQAAATGGDDYELLGTIAPSAADEFRAKVENIGIKLTFIGHIEEGAEVCLRDENGNILPLPEKYGFSHF